MDKIKNSVRKVKDTRLGSIINPLEEDAKSSMSTTLKLIISALTLVSGIAWNDAIKGLFEQMRETPALAALGTLAPFIYAITVTLITVIIIKRLENIGKKIVKVEKKNEVKKESE